MWLAGGLLAVSLLLVLRAAHGQGEMRSDQRFSAREHELG